MDDIYLTSLKRQRCYSPSNSLLSYSDAAYGPGTSRIDGKPGRDVKVYGKCIFLFLVLET